MSSSTVADTRVRHPARRQNLVFLFTFSFAFLVGWPTRESSSPWALLFFGFPATASLLLRDANVRLRLYLGGFAVMCLAFAGVMLAYG